MNESEPKSVESVPYSRFRLHLSPFLLWMWHFQDFQLVKVAIRRAEFSMQGSYHPRFAALLRVAQLRRRTPSRLGLPTSVRLANHAAIVASGLLLGLSRKEGDVIAERFTIRCFNPVYYRPVGSIPIEIRLHSLTESAAFFVYHADFSIGGNGEHAGDLVHHYTKAHKGL